MLGEVALTPDIFYDASYSTAAGATTHLQYLKEPLLHEVLVRDLCDGEWYRGLSGDSAALAPRGKELLRKLHGQQRLKKATQCSATLPQQDVDWCQEALDSSLKDPLDCVIASNSTKKTHSSEQKVVDVEKLAVNPWWTSRSPSLRLTRTTPEYLAALSRCLCSANSVMFIDPHLDPSRHSYRELDQLIKPCVDRALPAQIEIHRGRYSYIPEEHNQGPKNERDWEARFEAPLKPILANTGATIEVYIWDDFHDRHLVTNHVGINLPNGFDIDGASSMTTWSRLGRTARDDVQREFDVATGLHSLCHQFVVRP